MDRLLQGVIKFQEEDYQQHKELYESLQKAQNPDTLFIGCADSRVVPSRITGTLPGELFVIRNIGNIIPPYTLQNDTYLATSAAIEYAVLILGVENIIVCGHSNCGACQALYDNNFANNTQHFQKWIELLHPIKEQVALLSPKTKAKRTWLTEQINIKVQIDNLLTYPFIQEKIQEGKLKIFGWYYIIPTGEIMSYDLKTKEFKQIQLKEKQ